MITDIAIQVLVKPEDCMKAMQMNALSPAESVSKYVRELAYESALRLPESEKFPILAPIVQSETSTPYNQNYFYDDQGCEMALTLSIDVLYAVDEDDEFKHAVCDQLERGLKDAGLEVLDVSFER